MSIGALGKKTTYINIYDKTLLHPIPRALKRNELGAKDHDIFHNGFDLWNCYEISWLNNKNKPEVCIGEIIYSSASPFIIESKSLKLYLNSLNNTNYLNASEVQKLLTEDLSNVLETDVTVNLKALDIIEPLSAPLGRCIDNIDVYIPKILHVDPTILELEEYEVEEILYSDLLKSNCLITNQPDWGSVEISYVGRQIRHATLLKYLISFRNHNEFHEQCVERIFADILAICKPIKLSVYAKYTRRGGIDINPFRSTEKDYTIARSRLVRQ